MGKYIYNENAKISSCYWNTNEDKPVFPFFSWIELVVALSSYELEVVPKIQFQELILLLVAMGLGHLSCGAGFALRLAGLPALHRRRFARVRYSELSGELSAVWRNAISLQKFEGGVQGEGRAGSLWSARQIDFQETMTSLYVLLIQPKISEGLNSWKFGAANGILQT